MSFLTVVCKGTRLLQFGSIALDLDQRAVSSRGMPVLVSPAEFDVLALLLQNRNVPLTKERIAESVWGMGHGRDLRQIDMFIVRLRRSLQAVGLDDVIATVAGRGYAVLDDHGSIYHVPQLGARANELLMA